MVGWAGERPQPGGLGIQGRANKPGKGSSSFHQKNKRVQAQGRCLSRTTGQTWELGRGGVRQGPEGSMDWTARRSCAQMAGR